MMHYDDIYRALIDKVKIQENVCKALSMVAYKYFLKLYALKEYELNIADYSTLLLIGKTGSGKSTILKSLSLILDLPIIFINSKNLAQEGFQGVSFTQILAQELKNGVDLLKKGALVIFDEFDKATIAQSTNYGNHGIHFQQQILGYMEGAKLKLDAGNFLGNKQVAEIDTSNFLFIFSGTFEDLFSSKQPIGLVREVKVETDIYEKLNDYGLLPELLGRLGQVVVLDPITEKEYQSVFTSPNFVINKWKKFFEDLDPDLAQKFDAKLFQEAVIVRAIKKNLGLRGLVQVAEEVLSQFLIDNQSYFKYRTQTDYKFEE